MSTGVVVKNRETTLDKIRKYYLQGPDKVTLSEKQDKVRVNVLKVWNLMINYHSPEQAIKTMMNECNEGQGCSRAQAYRYLQASFSIFGNPDKNWKEAERYLIREDLMRLQQQAIKDRDGHLQLGVIKQRIKLGQFDKDTDKRFDPDKLKGMTYILKPHPAVIAMMAANQNGGAFDFNNLDTEDIPFHEIKPEDDAED